MKENRKYELDGSKMIKTFHGKVNGQTIEIDEDLDIKDGQEVEIQVRIVDATRKWGDGILSSAGGWANNPEIDVVMEEIQRARSIERRTQAETE